MNSIKAKLSAGIIGIILFFVGMTWFLNFNLMEKYYVKKNKAILLNCAEDIEKVDEDKLEEYIRYQERAKGMFIAVYNNKLENKFRDNYFSREKKMREPPRMMPEGGNNGIPEFRNEGEIKSENRNETFRKKSFEEVQIETKRREDFKMRMNGGLGRVPPEIFLKESIQELTEKKYIFRERKDEFKNIHFINLIYKKNNGDYIFIIKPNEAIVESARIAAKFSLFSGVITILLGIIFAVLFSKKFTRPILIINENAKKIANFKFDEECKIASKDEIGELGKSINIMSKKLSETIEKLKENNLKLEKEIEHERNMEKLRKEFVSSVSHELRTPVSLIRGYAEGLKYSVMDKEEDKEFYCDVIVDETQKMTKLISDLLDLAQIESGTYKIEKQNINISEITELIINKYSLIFKEKNINIDINIEHEMWIDGDRMRIEQVISNFINNGVNHIEGENKIEIKLENIGSKVKFNIFNTGKNIPEDAVNRIWESFYKVDKARSREYGGVGLGLSIVSGILKLHSAEYGFKNRENGVEFWFEMEKK